MDDLAPREAAGVHGAIRAGRFDRASPAVLAAITPEDARGWSRHCGMATPDCRSIRPQRLERFAFQLAGAMQPARRNQPWASRAVMVASAGPSASSSASRERAPLARKRAFSFDQACSIGFRSGEYGGR